MYYLTVNATDVEVKATLPIKTDAKADVLFEGRLLERDIAGNFTDVFKPFDVHIYRWR
jgi:hypothetical protein